jgi:hypothetical protein
MIWGYETSNCKKNSIGFITAPAGVVSDSGKWKMALLDDIRSHLAVANEDQRKRRGAVLLREAAAEIERLRSIMASDSDTPQTSQRTPPPASTPGEGTSTAECPYVTGTVTRYCTLTPFTLTDAERSAIVTALAFLREEADEPGVAQDADTLRGLLERTR